MLRPLYMMPSEMLTHGAGRSVTATSEIATYPRARLINRLPLVPVRAGAASASWTVTGPATSSNGGAVLNANSSGTYTIGGGITASIAQPTSIAPGVVPPLNGWTLHTAGALTLTSMTSVSVGFTTASAAAIIGELVWGRFRELPRPIEPGSARSPDTFNKQPDREQLGQVRMHDRGKAARSYSGTTTADAAGVQRMIDLYDDTRGGARFMLWVPDPLLNDCYAAIFDGKPTWTKDGPNQWKTTISLLEIPRKVWP